MDESLQDRLLGHAKAFDGLLSLIPAKMYYGEDTTNQWNKKKQSKEEAAAARRGRLDPDSALNRNAKEVMDERARNKRKLREMEQGIDEEEDQEEEGLDVPSDVEAEKPGEGLKKKSDKDPKKKQKLEEAEEAEQASEKAMDGPSKLSKKEEKRAAKREKKKEKRAEKASKRETEPQIARFDVTESSKRAENAGKKPRRDQTTSKSLPATEEDAGIDQQSSLDPAAALDFFGLDPEVAVSDASAPASEPHSPLFDANRESANNANGTEAASATTSISSTVPPSEKPKHIKIPADTSALRARLAAKIEALRAARKADGPDGKPIRTRQELIESRRAKEAQRKAHKRELRKQAKLEEERKREEALASNSPGMMSPAVELDESAAGNFAFGRVAFGDGAQLSHDLSYVLSGGKKKGPSDPKTALLKVQNQKKRLEELDEEKRKDIAEKDTWLTARRRAEGDKIRDDEAALKKAVKRKAAAKKKSEKQWKERVKGVDMAQKERQKKRDDNIRKRRDDKLLGKAGKKKRKAAAGGGAGGGAKKKGRPGFEGSLGVGGRRK